MVLGVDNDYPTFAQVKDIFCIEANFIFFEVRKLRTIEFDIHHHVYIIEHSSITVNSNTLYTPVPLKVGREDKIL